MQEFGENFAKPASLLNAEDNFILKQFGNLNRAIHFIADNKASLREEFGTGKTATPTGQALGRWLFTTRLAALEGRC